MILETPVYSGQLVTFQRVAMDSLGLTIEVQEEMGKRKVMEEIIHPH